jgi:hypothetical protein
MNKRNMAIECASYILSQDHEREDLIERIYNETFENNKSRIMWAKNSIWYIAMSLAYGKREANLELKQLLKEVDE